MLVLEPRFLLAQVVASLYMARSDVAYTVRSAALHVWKTIVSNTPRTLAEILPALMKSIISALASPGMLCLINNIAAELGSIDQEAFVTSALRPANEGCFEALMSCLQ